MGLIMAIYEDADRKGIVREIAKDLLRRKINEAFPEGWVSDDHIHASVKISGWDHEIIQYVKNPRIGGFAEQIARHLAIGHPPPAGWKLQSPNDPFIDELFDRYWP